MYNLIKIRIQKILQAILYGAVGYTWTYSEPFLSDYNKIYRLPEETKALAFFLVSPDNVSEGCMMFINTGGTIGQNGYNVNVVGIRPIVSLKSGVLLEKKSEGVYSIK